MKNKGLIYSFIVMLLWGLLFPTVKMGYRAFGISSVGDILSFAGLRFLICGILITAFAVVRNPQGVKELRKHWHMVLLSGLFAIILHYGFTYTALSLTDGSKTAILKQLGAVFYICFAALFFADDRLTWQKVIGLVLGIGGIVVINVDASGIKFQVGDLLIIAASFCTVFSNITSKKVFQYVEPILSTGVSQLFGGIVLLIVGLMSGGEIWTVVPKTGEQMMVLAVILMASIISYCLWFLIVQKEKLSKLFIIKFSEPLFAAIFGWILLGEDTLNANYIAAFILISAGIIVANLKKSFRKGYNGKTDCVEQHR